MYLLSVCEIEQIDVASIIQKKNVFINQVKDKIKELYIHDWEKSNRDSEGKLRFYFQFKKQFKFETYLDNIPREDRRAITKFRLSSHRLPIEVMRYQKTDVEERKCTICKINEVGLTEFP